MNPAFASDEAALRAAIEAAPADDAPWLVYADWLQERGRDPEAAAVRRFLPDIRAELAAGRDPAAVWGLVARQDPGGPAGGLGTPPARPPLIVPASAPLTVPQASQETRGRDLGLGGWLGIVIVGKAVVLLSLGVVRKESDQTSQPAPLNLTQFLTEDQLRYSRVVKDGKEYVTFPIRSRPPDDRWHPAELPGYTLRVEHAPGLVAIAFGADGRATMFTWPCPGIGFPAVASGRWAVDDADGVLTITGLAEGDPVRVRKLQGAGDYYKVSWNSR